MWDIVIDNWMNASLTPIICPVMNCVIDCVMLLVKDCNLIIIAVIPSESDIDVIIVFSVVIIRLVDRDCEMDLDNVNNLPDIILVDNVSEIVL